MEQDLLNLISQFGAAGLIAWMWLSERRHAGKREQQLTESHEQLREQRLALDQLLALIGANTRAVATLEAAQRALLDFLRRPPRLAERADASAADDRTTA